MTVGLLDSSGKPFVDHMLELALSQPLAQVNADSKRKSDDDDGLVDEGLVFEVHVSILLLNAEKEKVFLLLNARILFILFMNLIHLTKGRLHGKEAIAVSH